MKSIAGIFATDKGVCEKAFLIDQNGLISKEIKFEKGASYDLSTGENEIIFPGFIDIHVHAREDVSEKHIYKEDFLTVSNAAINGGVTYIAEMPNNPIPPINEESYLNKLALTSKSKIPVLLYAAITPDSTPLSFSVPYKIYLGPSTGSQGFRNYEEIEKKFELYRGESVSFHCEAPEILDRHKSESEHHLRRVPESEVVSIARAIELINKFKLRGKICHVSTGEGIKMVQHAKERGLDIEAEVSPHHLFFSTDEMDSARRHYMQMNPPIRASNDRIALRNALKSGWFDHFATDHAPHTLAEKESGISGLTALDTYASLALSFNLTFSEAILLTSKRPGAWINSFLAMKHSPHKIGPVGETKPNYMANFTVLTHQKYTIHGDSLFTKCGHSPYIGHTFDYHATKTIVAGVPLFSK